MNRITAAVMLLPAFAACCDSSLGPLAGTWQAGGMLPHKSTFHSGEIESDGMIDTLATRCKASRSLWPARTGS